MCQSCEGMYYIVPMSNLSIEWRTLGLSSRFHVVKSFGNWDPQMLQTHRASQWVWLFYVRPPIKCRSSHHLFVVATFFFLLFPSKLSNAIKSLKRNFLMHLEGTLYTWVLHPKKKGILRLVLKSENGITPIRITWIAYEWEGSYAYL